MPPPIRLWSSVEGTGKAELQGKKEAHMVSLRQEQNPIMKFDVPFHKMFALCMQYLLNGSSDLYAI